MTMRFLAAILLLFLLAMGGSRADGDALSFAGRDYGFLGVYEAADGRRLIAGAFPGADLVYVSDDRTGVFKILTATDTPGRYAFSARRNPGDDPAGHVDFSPGRLSWTGAGGPMDARRLPMRVEPMSIWNGEAARLSGWLLMPEGDGPFPGAVIITQSDRFDLWELSLHLVADGMAVLVYDQRDAEPGESSGDPVRGWYHEVQPVYAGDAVAALDALRAHPRVDAARTGVAGWSGGGWMGAMVAAQRPDLAFYVNVAGNASPHLVQAEHRLYARLFREGYPDDVIAGAAAFLDQHHEVARTCAGWEAYAAAREHVADEEWYVFLTSRLNITYDSLDDACAWGTASQAHPPSRDFSQVTVPTLGLFFEWDHSSPPETPMDFHRALEAGGNADYEIIVLPGLNHGGWITPGGYRWTSGEIEGRSPEVFQILRDWVARQVR